MSPIYDYVCENCKHEQTEVCKYTDEHECPTCKTKMTRQFPVDISVRYNCTGFYNTDYKNVERQKNGKRFGKKNIIKKGRGF